jgi:hypothetical protein
MRNMNKMNHRIIGNPKFGQRVQKDPRTMSGTPAVPLRCRSRRRRRKSSRALDASRSAAASAMHLDAPEHLGASRCRQRGKAGAGGRGVGSLEGSASGPMSDFAATTGSRTRTVPRSVALPSPAARFPRTAPLPAAPIRTPIGSLRRTTCIAIQRLRGTQYVSWRRIRYARRSPPNLWPNPSRPVE